VVERDISGKKDWTSREIAWLARSPVVTLVDIILWGHLKECVYSVLPRSMGDLVARLQPAVTMVDANMFRRIRVNSVRRIIMCLEMDGGRFEHLL
jgi:hypothetical protein